MRIKSLVCLMLVTFLMTYAHAEDLSKSIIVSNAWVQAMPPSQKITAAYMTIANHSSREVTIISASSMIAAATEIHQMSSMNGMMHMAMSPTVHIPPQGKVMLRPGGLHIMLINLKRPVHQGDAVPITLHFQDKGSIIVSAHVKAAND